MADWPSDEQLSKLFPEQMAFLQVKMALDAIDAHETAHNAAFPDDISPAFKGWLASMDDAAAEIDLSDSSLADLIEDARLGEDATHVAAILAAAENLSKLARTNLAGLHVGAKSSAIRSAVEGSPDVQALRDAVDNWYELLITLTTMRKPKGEGMMCDATNLWSVLPYSVRKLRKGKSVREYNGAKVPKTRDENDWPHGRSICQLIVDDKVHEGALAQTVKKALGLTYDEFKAMWPHDPLTVSLWSKDPTPITIGEGDKAKTYQVRLDRRPVS